MVRMQSRSRFRCALLAAVAISTFVPTVPALAQDQRRVEYKIEAGDLGDALKAVSRQSGKEIIFTSEAVLGRSAPALHGTFSADEAVRALLEGSNLVAQFRKDVIIIRGRSDPSSDLADRSTGNDDILVTGSRIHGGQIASPIIIQTAEQMRNAGQNSLSDVIRAIPQNFNGGQNPGIGLNVPSSSGSNIGAGTGLNLRGLGSDATLTLLNGHRLAYNALRQSVDISSIPFLAVDRIEIVADGASALYGSDAVAGVANIILKRDYDGLTTSARFGASTDGGNTQQQYGVLTGKTWNSGGFVAAFEYERDTPIIAKQRSYAAMRSPGLTLFPSLKHHSFMLSGHQKIADGLIFEWDGIYNKRSSELRYALTASGDYLASGGASFNGGESFAVAPSLHFEASPTWRFELAAIYGEDEARYRGANYAAGVNIGPTRGCYCNKAHSIELNGNGKLFDLPGGSAKVAVGSGYRSNNLHAFRTVGTAQNIRASQDSYYAFGELSLSLVSPSQNIPFLYTLHASAALRYENYPGVADVATPKIGLIYAPSEDFDIKGSWGRSFRAPTLYLQYNTRTASLFTAASRGGSGYPSASTVLYLAGGNPNLKPESARTWTFTMAAHPRALEGVRIEISYFNVDYRDRIAAPITFTAQALSNPIYADLVNRSPSDADKAAALNGAVFANAVGRPYDPAAVVAIINNTSLNVTRQSISGVDAFAEYRADLGSYGSLTATVNGSYLHTEQRISALQPVVELAGYVFNPPHFRGRGGITWKRDALTVTTYANYIGSVLDGRRSPAVPVDPMTTVDLTARYHLVGGPGILRNVEFALSAQNVLNAKPGLLSTTQVYEQPYDATNYSPFGRVVSLSISKRW